jgi:hypothetical protein
MAITIVKKDKFRSAGRGVNDSYDMIRVVVDMKIFEWRQVLRNRKKLLSDTEPTEAEKLAYAWKRIGYTLECIAEMFIEKSKMIDKLLENK